MTLAILGSIISAIGSFAVVAWIFLTNTRITRLEAKVDRQRELMERSAKLFAEHVGYHQKHRL